MIASLRLTLQSYARYNLEQKMRDELMSCLAFFILIKNKFNCYFTFTAQNTMEQKLFCFLNGDFPSPIKFFL